MTAGIEVRRQYKGDLGRHQFLLFEDEELIARVLSKPVRGYQDHFRSNAGPHRKAHPNALWPYISSAVLI